MKIRRGGTTYDVDISRASAKFAVLRKQIAARLQGMLTSIGQDMVVGLTQRYAPSPEEEEQVLVRGTIVEPWSRRFGKMSSGTSQAALSRMSSATERGWGFTSRAMTGGEAGTAEGGRYIKRGKTQKTIREALADQKWRKKKPTVLQNSVKLHATWGSWRKMARTTGFSYYQKSGRGRGRRTLQKTFPFNKDWPRTANFGGTWMVVPRPRGGAFQPPLAPERGVYAAKMQKQVSAYRYAQKAERGFKKWMVKTLKPAVITPAIRAAGLAPR